MLLSRRDFLVAGGVLGGGLVLGFDLSADSASASVYPHFVPGSLQPNAWLQVTPDNRIILQIHKHEMGQGILTALTTLAAEELNVHPSTIETQFAAVHPDYINPQYGMQVTSGSTSVVTSFVPVREAAAVVRTMLLRAAADAWNISAETLYTRDGAVLERDGNGRAPIGDFVQVAKTLPIPEQVELKSPADYQYIGKFDTRLDGAAKVDGSTSYGIDAVVPDALSAVVVRCPHFGGRLLRFNVAGAQKSPGIVDVFEIETGIAVVADNYWHARQAAQRLTVEWMAGEHGNVSSESIALEQDRLLNEAGAGDAPVGDGDTHSAEYTAPFQAHACMEPMNATVAIDDDRVDVWTSTQAADAVQAAVAEALNRPRAEVTVHSMFLGGGFGRRIYPDAEVEATLIADRVGRPVKTVWSREDDTRHDLYRPVAKCRMSAELDGSKVRRWHFRVCAPSHVETLIIRTRALHLPGEPDEVVHAVAAEEARKIDRENLGGADNTPYRLGDMRAEQIMWRPGIPVGFWRSVGHSFNGFFVEGFIDEMAQQAGIDEVLFRRNHLAADSRERVALDLVVHAANWGKTKPGVFQGVAVNTYHGTPCAQVAEVQVEQNEIRVTRVVCAVDCGVVINPDIVRAQIEGGIVWGLTAALKNEITIKNGAVQQSNFHDYPILTMAETPEMEIHLIESDHSPSGIGESAVAPVAPAVANAVFKATGQRLRSLPLRLA